MALQDYVKKNDAEFSDQLKQACAVLPTYFVELGVTAASSEVVSLNADSLVFEYQVLRQNALVEAARGSTGERNRARFGDVDLPSVPVNMAYPTAPAVVPSPVLPGIETRFRKFVEFIRTREGYTPAIGDALGFVGEDHVPQSVTTAKPLLELMVSGFHVGVGWKWQGMARVLDAIRLEVDRGQGWQFLAVDTNPGYTDTTPFPATPQKWKYRAIFMRNEGPVGLWSDVAEIVVGG